MPSEPLHQSLAQPRSAALPGMRLLDPDVVSPAFQQLQQVKSYYQFPGELAMDRYPVPGGSSLPQDTVVAVRDMGGPPAGQANWINTHLVYTHGFGFVAATANTRAGQRQPVVHRERHPAARACSDVRQPRVYFGEQQNTYAIVGGPPGGPAGARLPDSERAGQQNNTYHGGGGVAIGSPLNRLLYAIKFRELNILLSGAINGNSKILYDQAAAGPGGQGRAVPHPGRQHLPGRGRAARSAGWWTATRPPTCTPTRSG